MLPPLSSFTVPFTQDAHPPHR